MFGSPALNVVIGLIFIYLLYSLLATIIQEIISTFLGTRARMLEHGIIRMLEDGTKSTSISSAFYAHPLIKYLGQHTHSETLSHISAFKNKYFGHHSLRTKPSYLSSKNFSKVLIDLLRGNSVKPGEGYASIIQNTLNTGTIPWTGIDGSPKNLMVINKETLTYLKSLWADAEGDVEKFRALLDAWFDDTMERATGWYKKHIQFVLFFIGFTLAVIFNIDTISISKKLARDPKLAEQLANNASVYVSNHSSGISVFSHDSTGSDSIKRDSAKQDFEKIILKADTLVRAADSLINENIDDANHLLGLGWNMVIDKKGQEHCKDWHWYTVFGWLITALAISLGAPFWFDLLSKVMKLRGAGNTTESEKKS